MPLLGPRLVVAGTHSGVGKTTVATGLMAALRSQGLRVGAAKVGPDFVDPGYHRLAAGRASRSLDAFLSGEDLLAPIAARAGEGCEVLVVEGVMGLFDGSGLPGCDGSTAAVARALEAPVLLVVDAAAMSGSVAAVVHGFKTLDPRVRLAGVVLNRVGGDGHALLLREALEPVGLPVLGVLFEDDRLVWRERHLGLVPVAERPEAVRASIDTLGRLLQRSFDLDSVVRLARSAPRRPVAELPAAREAGRCRIAICAGPAFSFTYPENLELFRQAGAELAWFDPLEASCLPERCSGLYAGGGFPEVFAEALSDNLPLLAELRRRAGKDLVTWAECGGFMWLCESIDGHAMAKVIPGVHVEMGKKLSIGYRQGTTSTGSFLGPAGTALRGHEFHRSSATPPGKGLVLTGRLGSGTAGYVDRHLFASYLHQHLSAVPVLAERFVAAATRSSGDPLPGPQGRASLPPATGWSAKSGEIPALSRNCRSSVARSEDEPGRLASRWRPGTSR